MRRDKLIEMLSGIEIEVKCTGRNNSGDYFYEARISNKSCEDIADFVQDELREQRQREEKRKNKKS
jgi:hypothetical protein